MYQKLGSTIGWRIGYVLGLVERVQADTQHQIFVDRDRYNGFRDSLLDRTSSGSLAANYEAGRETAGLEDIGPEGNYDYYSGGMVTGSGRTDVSETYFVSMYYVIHVTLTYP